MNPFTSRDAEAIEQSLAGDPSAFESIVQRYYPVVNAVAYSRTGNSLDAEDVAQETFLKAFQALSSLRHTNKLGPWLVGIARNVAATHTAKARPRSAERADQEAPEPDHARLELHQLLKQTVLELDDTNREALLLYYYAGKDTREIAKLLDISKHAAEKRLQRARLALGDHLSEDLKEALKPERPTHENAKRAMKSILALPVLQHPTISPQLAATQTAASLAFKSVLGAAVASSIAVTVYLGTREPPQDPYRLPAPQIAQDLGPGQIDAPDETVQADESASTIPGRRTAAVSVDASSSISGQVINSEGKPIAKARVRAITNGPFDKSDSTDKKGRFRLEKLAGLPYTIRVTHPRYVSAHYPEIQYGAKDLNFVLLRRPILEGQVLDGSTGKPIPEYTLTYQPRGIEKRVLNEIGRFTLTGLKAEMAGSITATARGYASATLPVPALAPEEIYSGLVARLFPVPLVEGLVVDWTGKPVSGALLSTNEFRAELKSRAQMGIMNAPLPNSEQTLVARIRVDENEYAWRTESDGSFRYDFLPLSTTHIYAFHQTLGVGVSRISMLPVNRKSPTIVLGGTGSVKGTVLLNGKPYDGVVTVNLSHESGHFSTQFWCSELHGAFELEGLYAGKTAFEFSLSQPDNFRNFRSRILRQTLIIEAGQSTEFLIDAKLGTSSLELDLENNGESYSSSATVTLETAYGEESMEAKYREGPIVFENLSAGLANISFTAALAGSGYRMTRKAVVNLQEAKRTSIVFQRGSSTLELDVRMNGSPSGGYTTVSLETELGEEKVGSQFESGHFVFNNLYAGIARITYRHFIHKPSGSQDQHLFGGMGNSTISVSRNAEVVLEENKTTSVVFDWGQGAETFGHVEGVNRTTTYVRAYEGIVDEPHLNAVPEFASARCAVESGEFHLMGLPAGVYTLQASQVNAEGGKYSTPVTITLQENESRALNMTAPLRPSAP